MKINDLKVFISSLVKANVNVPTLMVGGMGLGKSQLMAQVAKENEMQLVDLRLAQMESCDLIGMPYRATDGTTQWAQPGWWPKEGTRGIIFLDELNRAPTDVRQAVFQLVLDRKLHTHKLPVGWFVHSAVNPDNGEYQVETLDKAMLRRFCVLEVTPDVDVWLAWAKNSGTIENTLTEFISTNRKLLYQTETIKLDIIPTPDSYRMLNEMIKAKVVAREHQAEIFAGLIGKEASVALIKWLDTSYEKPVSGVQILTDYQKFKAKVKKQRNDENYTTTTDLVACLSDKKVIPDDHFKNLVDYILDLPKESQTAVISKLSQPATKPVLEQLLKNKDISKLLINIMSQ